MDSPLASNVDPTLLELFRAELDAHIPVLNDGLLSLEKGPAEERAIASMMRAAHSIKGAARIVGLDAAVRLAHALEDCFTAAKDNRIPLPSAAVDVLLKGVDALQRICSRPPDADCVQTELELLLKQIAAVRDGQAITSDSIRLEPPTDALKIAERLTLPANLDDSAAARLRVQLCEALRHGTSRICLDFTHVDHVSAGAVAVLVSLAREVAGMSTAPALVAEGVAGSVAALLRTTGLERTWSAGG